MHMSSRSVPRVPSIDHQHRSPGPDQGQRTGQASQPPSHHNYVRRSVDPEGRLFALSLVCIRHDTQDAHFKTVWQVNLPLWQARA